MHGYMTQLRTFYKILLIKGNVRLLNEVGMPIHSIISEEGNAFTTLFKIQELLCSILKWMFLPLTFGRKNLADSLVIEGLELELLGGKELGLEGSLRWHL